MAALPLREARKGEGREEQDRQEGTESEELRRQPEKRVGWVVGYVSCQSGEAARRRHECQSSLDSDLSCWPLGRVVWIS